MAGASRTVKEDHLSCFISHPSLFQYNNASQSAFADHRVPVHLFQNDTMLCRPAGRIARALQGCCWAELGLEVKVTTERQMRSGCNKTCMASDRVESVPDMLRPERQPESRLVAQ